jgi:hypothetical protein
MAGTTPETILFGRTTYEAHRGYQGKRIDEIARGMDVEPAEAIIELIDKADGSTTAVYFGMRDEDVQCALRLPWVAIEGRHGGGLKAFCSPHPHPAERSRVLDATRRKTFSWSGFCNKMIVVTSAVPPDEASRRERPTSSSSRHDLNRPRSRTAPAFGRRAMLAVNGELVG